MGKRFTDTEKWRNPFIRGLKTPYKLLWLYILDDCDIAGVWQLDFEVAALRLGIDINPTEAKQEFGEHVIEVDPGRRWFVPSFIEFQYGAQLSKTNNIFKSIEKILNKYDLYQYLTVEITEEGTTISSFRNRISQKVRDRVFLEAEFICQYCSEQKAKHELVVDHFVPLNRGGDNSDENLVCSCIRCNSHKTDLMPEDFLIRPLQFLKTTDRLNSLFEAYKNLKGAFKDLSSPKDKDKDKYKDKEVDKEKVKRLKNEKEEIDFNSYKLEFVQPLKDWFEYRKNKKKSWEILTQKQADFQYKELLQVSKSDHLYAAALVVYNSNKGYQTFYEIPESLKPVYMAPGTIKKQMVY